MSLQELKSEIERDIKIINILNSPSEFTCVKMSIYAEILDDIKEIEKKEFLNKMNDFKNLALTS